MTSQRIRFWPEGARTAGRCAMTRDCLGVMMVVESLEHQDWAQCSVCLQETGLGKGRAPSASPLPPAKTGDAFLDNT